jgi:hypothetical protein
MKPRGHALVMTVLAALLLAMTGATMASTNIDTPAHIAP